MDKTFKINMYFDGEGEEIEKLIEYYLTKKLKLEHMNLQDNRL